MAAVGAQVAARMGKMAAEIEAGGRKAVSAGALDAKNVLLGSIHRAAPSGRLRGVGRAGARLGVNFTVKGSGNPSAVVRATGPLHLLENPSKAHEITPRKRGGKKALNTPYGPRKSVQHPGVRNPKRPWAKGLPAAEKATKAAVSRTYVDAFRRGAR